MIKLHEPFLCGNEWKYIKNCLDEGWVSSAGKYVDLFEKKIAGFYGSQAICIMIDHKKINGEIKLYSCCGTRLEKITLKKHIENLNTLSCGEIILNSIDNDGNAAGIDLSILDNIGKSIGKPILIMGGAGKPEHLSSVLTSKKISGVITANLFNFLGDGLKVARNFALENNIRLAKF